MLLSNSLPKHLQDISMTKCSHPLFFFTLLFLPQKGSLNQMLSFPPSLVEFVLQMGSSFEWQIHGNNGIFSALHYDRRGKVATHLILNWAWFAHSDLFNPGQSGRPWKSAFDIRFYPIYHRLSFIIQPTVPPGYRGCSNICLSIHWSSICWNEMVLKKDLCCLFHSKRLLLWISISLHTFRSPEDFSERSKAFLYIDVF